MDKKRFQVRPATVGDLDALMVLEQSSYNHPWSLEQLRPEFDNPVATVTVCTDGGRIVGSLCSWLIVGEMQILKVTTSPEMRRQGIAARLLDDAFGQPGLHSAWLEVREFNGAAIALYQSLGFNCEGRRKAYYSDGEDALLMMKKF
jgi:ribosomal-protein-alanine N-acetyltransferase